MTEKFFVSGEQLKLCYSASPNRLDFGATVYIRRRFAKFFWRWEYVDYIHANVFGRNFDTFSEFAHTQCQKNISNYMKKLEERERVG